MPQRRIAEGLPFIPHLPVEYDRLARAVLSNPRTAADSILLLAEALDEVADGGHWHGEQELTLGAVNDLAAELRRRAPGYA